MKKHYALTTCSRSDYSYGILAIPRPVAGRGSQGFCPDRGPVTSPEPPAPRPRKLDGPHDLVTRLSNWPETAVSEYSLKSYNRPKTVQVLILYAVIRYECPVFGHRTANL